MRVWYDACTGKHVRYGAVIAKRLRRLGHEVVLTTREHPDTLALANLLKERFTAVGKYSPTSPLSRLRESLKRQLAFCKMFREHVPDVAMSHRSVELCRIAFGLRIPNVSTHDSVHAEAINRLTMPLIDYLAISKALPKNSVKSYGIKKIFWFDGVDEVAWIKDFKPDVKYEYERPLIVIRELETKAAYAQEKEDQARSLLRKLASLGNVLLLQRYGRRQAKDVIIPEEFVDSAAIVSQADLVISAGGTIAREAALQGTPTIVIRSFEKLYVNDYLSKKGFPIFTIHANKVLSHAKRLIGRRRDVKDLLNSLEDPVETIERIVKDEIGK